VSRAITAETGLCAFVGVLGTATLTVLTEDGQLAGLAVDDAERPSLDGAQFRARPQGTMAALGGITLDLGSAGQAILPQAEAKGIGSKDLITVRLRPVTEGHKRPRARLVAPTAPIGAPGLLTPARPALARALAQADAKESRIDRRIDGFEGLDLDAALANLSAASLPGPMGGTLHVDVTRAAVLIDHDGGDQPPNAALAKALISETVRQIRLRGLAGQILIDPLRLARSGQNRGLEAHLAQLMQSDPWGAPVCQRGPLGLLEIQRRRADWPLSHWLDRV